jgi:hypothetical protein
VSEREHLTQQHRPPNRKTLRAAACELLARGRTVRDIASALRLTEGAVPSLLGDGVNA